MPHAGDLIPVDDDSWRPWTPAEAAEHFAPIRVASGRPVRWAVAGGWAIDCFLGRTTRDHDDLEVVVLEDDVPAVLSAFRPPEWEWLVPDEDRLHPVRSVAFRRSHQTWLQAGVDGRFVLDVFRNPHKGDTWICRREATITSPWSAVTGVTADGVPYLTPEVVLLFKAKYARPKDVADFEQALPRMRPAQLEWLRSALVAVHPEHAWIRLL